MPSKILDVHELSIDLVNEGGVEFINIPRAKFEVPYRIAFGTKYLATIMLLNKAASEMLLKLIWDRNFLTNEVQYVVAGTNAKCKLTRAYNELKKKDLVKRVRQQHYIINPAAVLPKYSEYDRVLSHWESV